MPSNKHIIVLLAIAAFAAICTSFGSKPAGGGLVIPPGWPRPTYDFSKNKWTEAGFRLGRKLFYDPALSADGTISCASCHSQWNAFTHVDHGMSHGINGLKGTRNSFVLFNLAWNKSFMWDGGVNHLEVQPLAPITNPVEMGNTLAGVVKNLDTARGYRQRFYEVFGDSTITGQRVLKALTQFIGSFQSFNSRYDKYMRHEPGGELTEQELAGLALFRNHCNGCHTEPLFTDYSFRNIGLPPDTAVKDYGRMLVTHHPADSLKFRVPTLRNIELSYPYLHDGRFKSIRQVLDHYTNGIVQGPTLALEMWQRMPLTDRDKKDLIAFLRTLTDKEFILDPRFRDMRE